MHGKQVAYLMGAFLVSALLLTGCQFGTDEDSRATMSGEDASAARFAELSDAISGSDAEALTSAFSEEARSQDGDLAEQAGDLISAVGGGSLTPDQGVNTQGSVPSGSIYVVSRATITAQDGSRWLLNVVDCTYNEDEPKKVGLWAMDLYPAEQPDEPESYTSSGVGSDPGIVVVRTWEEWRNEHPHAS